jgi:hypothetical protein
MCNPGEKIVLTPKITPETQNPKNTRHWPKKPSPPKPAPTANLRQTRFPFPSRFQIQSRGKNMPCRTV